MMARDLSVGVRGYIVFESWDFALKLHSFSHSSHIWTQNQTHSNIFLHCLRSNEIILILLRFAWTLSRVWTPDSNLVLIWSRRNPEVSLNKKKSRLRKKSGQEPIMDILVADVVIETNLWLLVVHFQDIKISLSPQN